MIGIGTVRGELPRPGRPRPAGDELPRARRHDRQPRRAPAAPAPRRARAVPRRARLDLEAGRALRASTLSPHAALVFDEVSAACFGGIAFGDIGEHTELPAPAASQPRLLPRLRHQRPPAAAAGDGFRLVAYRPLFSGSRRRPRRPSSSSSAPPARSRSRAPTPAPAASATAQPSPSRRMARQSSCAPASRATSRAGTVRIATASTQPTSTTTVNVKTAEATP